MLGHVFPIFFQFKGGKGVATSVGIFAVCCPIAIIIGLCVFAVSTLLSRIVSLSSLIATVTVVVMSVIFYDRSGSLAVQIILSVAMGLIVFLKHKENIIRLINGEENKIGRRK
jgi:glycerol-3-phosphate acyltransferase PlsY